MATTTVIGTGETRTTIQAWEDNELSKDITGDQTQIGTCKAEAFTNVIINGATTDATHFIHLTSVDNSEHDGRAHEVSGAGNARIECDSDAHCVSIFDEYCEVSWLEIKGPGNYAKEVLQFEFISASWERLHHCIIHNNNANNSNAQYGIRIIDADGLYRIYRNVVYGVGSNGFYLQAGTANSALYYNTIWDNNHSANNYRAGIRCDDADYTIEGNAVFDNSNKDFYGVTGTLDYNADSDNTETEGANTLNSLTSSDELTNPTTTWADTDLTIKAGSNLINEGNDPLSGTYTDFPEINYPISDRDNAITGTWDIGADEYVAAGGGTTYEESCSDGLNLGESVSHFLTIPLSLTDGFTSGEALANQVEFNPVITDGLSLSETLTPNLIYQLSLTDGLTLGEVLNFFLTLPLSVTDGITTTDTPTNTVNFNPVVSDGVSIGDTNSAICTLLNTLTDGIFLGDTPINFIDFRPTVTDGVTMSDSPSTSVILGITVTDGVILSEVLSALGIFINSISDGIVLSDQAAGGNIFNKAVTDGLTLSDSSAISLTINKLLTEGVSLSEVLNSQVNFDITITDGVKMSDVISNIITFALSISDGINLSDITVSTVTTAGAAKINFITKNRTFNFIVKSRDLHHETKNKTFNFITKDAN